LFCFFFARRMSLFLFFFYREFPNPSSFLFSFFFRATRSCGSTPLPPRPPPPEPADGQPLAMSPELSDPLPPPLCPLPLFKNLPGLKFFTASRPLLPEKPFSHSIDFCAAPFPAVCQQAKGSVGVQGRFRWFCVGLGEVLYQPGFRTLPTSPGSLFSSCPFVVF